MVAKPPGYKVFMLRVWPVKSRFGMDWRASLKNVLTGECHNFANPDALFRYLLTQLTQMTMEMNRKDVKEDVKHSISGGHSDRSL